MCALGGDPEAAFTDGVERELRELRVLACAGIVAGHGEVLGPRHPGVSRTASRNGGAGPFWSPQCRLQRAAPLWFDGLLLAKSDPLVLCCAAPYAGLVVVACGGEALVAD